MSKPQYSCPGLLPGLALLLTGLMLSSSCDLLSKAAQGISHGINGPQSTAPNQVGTAGLPGNMSPATKQDIDALWNSYSAEDRQLLADNNMDRSQLDGMEGMLDVQTIRQMLDSQLQMYRPMELHPKSVVIGKALQWRELDSFTKDMDEYAAIVAGNFDDDADAELLLNLRGFEILELDGSRRSLPGLDGTELGIYGVWDMDGDGRSELLAVSAEYSAVDGGDSGMQTSILALDGQVLATLEGMSMYGPHATADLDGDGFAELLLTTYDMTSYAASLKAYGRAGKEIWQQNGIGMGEGMVTGDVDGDGLDELLAAAMDPQSGMPGRVMAYGIRQEATAIPGLTDNSLIGPPMFCIDINGDGMDEILVGRNLLNPVDGIRSRLAKPQGWSEMQLGGGMGLGCGLLRRDGQAWLVARCIEGMEDWRSDTLLMWDAAGQLVYEEHIGEELVDLRVVHSASGERVVLQTRSRLLLSEVKQPLMD
jgi:hypothetical protein